MAVDGRWANGVLGGSWRKDSAGFIGEGAREAARRARIDRLRADLAETRTRIAALGEELDDLAARRETLTAEHRALPATPRCARRTSGWPGSTAGGANWTVTTPARKRS